MSKEENNSKLGWKIAIGGLVAALTAFTLFKLNRRHKDQDLVDDLRRKINLAFSIAN